MRAGRCAIAARAGVVLAGGGFIGNLELRDRLLPKVSSFAPGAPTGSGGLIELALGLGARLGEEGIGHAFWAPVSVRTRRDGSQAVFPHFVLDRAKPGTLVVDQTGRRFLNESTSYNFFARAMIAADAVRPSIPAFLIADRRALDKIRTWDDQARRMGRTPFAERWLRCQRADHRAAGADCSRSMPPISPTAWRA